MKILLLFVGLIIGLIIGVVWAIQVYHEMDKRAASDGVIKLCGKYYRLTKIDL